MWESVADLLRSQGIELTAGSIQQQLAKLAIRMKRQYPMEDGEDFLPRLFARVRNNTKEKGSGNKTHTHANEVAEPDQDQDVPKQKETKAKHRNTTKVKKNIPRRKLGPYKFIKPKINTPMENKMEPIVARRETHARAARKQTNYTYAETEDAVTDDVPIKQEPNSPTTLLAKLPVRFDGGNRDTLGEHRPEPATDVFTTSADTEHVDTNKTVGAPGTTTVGAGALFATGADFSNSAIAGYNTVGTFSQLGLPAQHGYGTVGAVGTFQQPPSANVNYLAGHFYEPDYAEDSYYPSTLGVAGGGYSGPTRFPTALTTNISDAKTVSPASIDDVSPATTYTAFSPVVAGPENTYNMAVMTTQPALPDFNSFLPLVEDHQMMPELQYPANDPYGTFFYGHLDNHTIEAPHMIESQILPPQGDYYQGMEGISAHAAMDHMTIIPEAEEDNAEAAAKHANDMMEWAVANASV